MGEVSLLLIGACTISGLGLPGTLSLPVLISRAFRRQQDSRLRIEAENHINTLGQLLSLLKEGKYRGPYDIIVMQSLIGRETIPRLGVGARLNHPGLLGSIYRFVRRVDFTPSGHRVINWLRAFFGRPGSPADQYEQTLKECLNLFRQASPGVKIIVLGQSPPLSPIRSVFAGVCEQNRQKMHLLALKHQFDFIDLYPFLLPHPVDEIIQKDGLHYTAKGQRIVAEAIIGRIQTTGIVNGSMGVYYADR